MKKNAIVFSILFLLPYFLFSQNESSSKSKITQSIGLTASMISGHGLSYEIGFNKKHSLEANVFIANLTNNDNSTDNNQNTSIDLYSSYGLEYHYILFTHKRLAAGLMIGGAYQYDVNEYTYSELTNQNQDEFKDSYISLGGGFLMELYSKSRNWKINLDFGFAYRYHKEVNTGTLYWDPYTQNRESIDKYSGFAIGGGIYYNF